MRMRAGQFWPTIGNDTPKTPLKFKRYEFAVLGGTHHLTISSFNAKFPAGLGLHRAGMSMDVNGCQ